MIEFITPSDWQTVAPRLKILCRSARPGSVLTARVVAKSDFDAQGFHTAAPVSEFLLSARPGDGCYAGESAEPLPGGAFIIGVEEQGTGQPPALIGVHVRAAESAGQLPGDLAAMFDEIAAGDGLYRPSRFWDAMSALNTRQIVESGFDNFKRTVNQNYYNWIPEGSSSNQFRNLLRFWSEHSDMLPLRVQIDDVDLLQGFFEGNPLKLQENRDLYRLFVGLLWLYAQQQDAFGMTARLEEPALGNPIRTTLDGRLISQDLANSIREWTAVKRRLDTLGRSRPVIAELGAGYGRLADVALKTSDCRYMIFDIPPALWLSQRYIAACNPDKRVFAFRHFNDFSEVREQVESSDIAFFSANQIDMIPEDYIDGFVAISCLHEMRKEQIRNYKDHISRVTREFFYTKNWKEWKNSSDGIEIRYEDIRMTEGWTVAAEASDPIQDDFMESMFVKGSKTGV